MSDRNLQPTVAESIWPVLVIIPTYNEIGNIDRVVDEVLQVQPDVQVLVVDDNSPDGTGAQMQSRAAADTRIHVIHRPGKLGLGAAYVNGFTWAQEHGFNSVVEMDADGSHRAQDLPLLLTALETCEAVIGSRWVVGGAVVNWPKRRELLSRGGNLYTRLWLGMSVSDATGGYRAYRMRTLVAIDYTTVKSQGYCFQVDLTWRCIQAGIDIREVPITFVERTVGVSKMSKDIVREAMKEVTRWGIHKRRSDLARMFNPR